MHKEYALKTSFSRLMLIVVILLFVFIFGIEIGFNIGEDYINQTQSALNNISNVNQFRSSFDVSNVNKIQSGSSNLSNEKKSENKNIEKFLPVNDILMWKTYLNDDYGFSFKYPDNWKIESSKCSKENLQELKLEDCLSVSFTGHKTADNGDTWNISMFLDVYNKNDAKSLDFYEGNVFERNYLTEKNIFDNLEPGKKISDIYTYMNYSNILVDTKINSNGIKFISAFYFFKPAAALDKVAFHYKDNYVFEFKGYYQPYIPDDTFLNSYDINLFPENVRTFSEIYDQIVDSFKVL